VERYIRSRPDRFAIASVRGTTDTENQPMSRIRLASLIAAALLAISSSAHAVDWGEDVQTLAREMPRIHPGLFHRMSRASWDSALASVEARLPSMSRDQAVVALMELVALARDGHTSIHPVFDPSLGFRYYPFEASVFSDGVFVTAADPKYPGLAGSRLVAIGKTRVEDALAAAARTLPAENEWWTRAWAPQRLAIPEVLDGLGLVEDMERLPLTVERDGRREVVVVRPAGKIEPRGHDPNGGMDRSGWTSMRTGPAPAWQRNPGLPYWVEYQAADRTLYVCERAVMSMDHGESSVEFWRRVFATADSLPVDRFVLDIRENGGGNNFLNRQVVRGLVRRAAIDRPGKLFVVIGGKTFSAAMNLALDLEKWTDATFVGEPTGNATSFYGDHQALVLPKSGITVNVSTLPWRPYDPRDRRDFLAPRLFTPMTSAQYAQGRDPALETILALGGRADPIAAVESALARGDSAAAQRAFDGARRDEANRFRSFEADLNRVGYGLLNSGRSAAALAAFRMNTRAYPASANAWDSLGEALAIGGLRDAAIAAYRRALAIDPGFRASRDALERLTAHR
jgi:hypothetical protein